eukprot:3407795-Prymnesium_polylepis.1
MLRFCRAEAAPLRTDGGHGLGRTRSGAVEFRSVCVHRSASPVPTSQSSLFSHPGSPRVICRVVAARASPTRIYYNTGLLPASSAMKPSGGATPFPAS